MLLRWRRFSRGGRAFTSNASYPAILFSNDSRMQKYLKVFDIGLQNTFVYRWNFFFRSIFGLFPLLGTVFIWGAIFEAKGKGINNFDYASVVYYFLLVLLLESLITPGDDEWQVAADIRDGQMNSFLIKPVNYLVYRLALFVSKQFV